MRVLLQDASIERPERLFEVELVISGVARTIVVRTIHVLAQTARGARRICGARYRRFEVRAAREAVCQVQSGGSCRHGM